MFRPSAPRNLVVVLGDQLDPASAALDGFDRSRDALWMAEVLAESTHVWSSKPRTALFLAAMRHFRDDQRARGFTVHYRELDDPENRGSLGAELEAFLRAHRPERVILVEPGDHRVAEEIAAATRAADVPQETRVDRHFYCTRERFAAHPRLAQQVRNLDRLPASRQSAIQAAADQLRQNHGLPPAAPGVSTLPGF